MEQELQRQRARRRTSLIIGLALIALAVAAFYYQANASRDAAQTTTDGCTHSQPAKGNAETPAAPPPMTIDPAKTYMAVIDTSCGSIEIELAAATSPNTVNSFVFLARQGFYNGLEFHRIVRDFAIQGGDPMGNGTGSSNYKTLDPPPPGFTYVQGTVAMAKTQAEPPGTGGSQFFIVPGNAAAATLTPDYAVLGKVVGGQDAVSRLNSVATEPADPQNPASERSAPVRPVYIRTITVRES